MTIGGGLGPDIVYGRDTAALYVEGTLFIQRANNNIITTSQIERMYEFHLGKDADIKYEKLMKELGDESKTEIIEIPDSILSWSEAVNKARNPDEEITKFFAKNRLK